MLQDQLASPWAALLPYTHTCTHAHTICCHYRAYPRFQMLWHPSLQPHVPVFSQRPSTRPLRPHIQVPCDEAPCSSLVPTSLPSPHLCRSWPPPIAQGCRAVSVHAPPEQSVCCTQAHVPVSPHPVPVRGRGHRALGRGLGGGLVLALDRQAGWQKGCVAVIPRPAWH